MGEDLAKAMSACMDFTWALREKDVARDALVVMFGAAEPLDQDMIGRAMGAYNLSLRKLAGELGLSPTYLSMLRHRKALPTRRFAAKFRTLVKNKM